MEPHYEIREMPDEMKDLPRFKIDFDQLNWTLLENLAKATPMKVQEQRNNLRNHIISVARLAGQPRLEAWGQSLSNAGLDMVCHFGLLESYLWSGLTTTLDESLKIKGLNAFAPAPTTVSDGQHLHGAVQQ
jgi:hypothetical protein